MVCYLRNLVVMVIVLPVCVYIHVHLCVYAVTYRFCTHPMSRSQIRNKVIYQTKPYAVRVPAISISLWVELFGLHAVGIAPSYLPGIVYLGILTWFTWHLPKLTAFSRSETSTAPPCPQVPWVHSCGAGKAHTLYTLWVSTQVWADKHWVIQL